MESPKKNTKKRKISSSPEVSKSKGCSLDVEDDIENKITNKDDKNEGESSPARCPICLAMPENKAKSEACSHYFCYRCLKEWSKVKAECPLCKMPIRTIYYNIRSDREFDEYHVKQPRNDNLHHIYDHDSYDDWWSIRMQQYRNQIRRRRENELAAIEACSNIPLIRRRRMYYWQKLKVSEVRAGSRVRDISAEFYRENPSQIHRLVPWLKRELTVLYGAHNKALIRQVRDNIISAVPNVDMTSQSFYHLIQPYLVDHTEQFIHEFIAFARSPYDVRAYDRHAVYNTAYTTSHDAMPRYEMTTSEGYDSRNRPLRNPLRSRWDDSPEEAGQMPSNQSLVLSQTSWNEELVPTIYPDVNVLWPVVSLQGTRTRGIGPRDATPPTESVDFQNPTPPRNYPATIADTTVTYSQLLGNAHPARRMARTIHYRSSDNVDVEAPLVHQTIFSHRPGTSARYDWMERRRRRYLAGLLPPSTEKRKKKTRSNRQPTTAAPSGDVIVISSDSGENVATKSFGTSNPLLFQSQKRKIKREKSPDSSNSDSSSNDSSHSSKDSDIEFVKYIKPPHLRTPDAYINLDSGSDNDKPGPSSRVINIKRVQTKQPVTSQSSSTSYSTSSDESDISKRRYSRNFSSGICDITMSTVVMSSTCIASSPGLPPREGSPIIAKINSVDVSEGASGSRSNGGKLKKIFEKGKGSVSLDNGRNKNKFMDTSDSGSDIDVGVEDNRTARHSGSQNSSNNNISSGNREKGWRNSRLSAWGNSNLNKEDLQNHQNTSTNESHPRTTSNEDVLDVQFIRQSSQETFSSVRERRPSSFSLKRDGRRSNESQENLSERSSLKSHRHKSSKSKRKKKKDSQRSNLEENGKISNLDEKGRQKRNRSSRQRKKLRKSRRRSRSASVELIPFHRRN